MKNEAIFIKGTKEGIVIGIKEEQKIADLKANLKQKLDSCVELLASDNRIIIDSGSRNVNSREKKEINKMIKKFSGGGSKVISWKQSNAGGHVISMETREEIDMKNKKDTVKKDVSANYEISIQPVSEKQNAEIEKPNNEQPVANKVALEGEDETLLIKRTLRSGQSIQFDGNVVVLGDVNPGAEIVASGNIIIMGSFRGVAHAGAMGDESAIVTAFRLQPTQLRIANHITRAPDGEYLPPDQPEIARIRDGVVMIEAYQANQEKQMKIG